MGTLEEITSKAVGKEKINVKIKLGVFFMGATYQFGYQNEGVFRNTWLRRYDNHRTNDNVLPGIKLFTEACVCVNVRLL